MRRKILIILALIPCALVFAGEGEDYFSRGKNYLNEGDFILAEEQFDAAAKAEPRLNDDIGVLWFGEAEKRAAKGEFESAAAMFSKAVFYNSDLAPKAGDALLASGAAVESEDAWMRIAHRAIPFAGAPKVLTSSLHWYEKRWGTAKKVVVENPGWLSVGEGRPGYALRYLSESPFLEQDGELMRVMPAAVERAMEFPFDSGPAEVLFSKQKDPATVYVWIIPTENPKKDGEPAK